MKDMKDIGRVVVFLTARSLLLEELNKDTNNLSLL